MKKFTLTLLVLGTVLALQAQVRLIAVKGKTTNTVVKTINEAIKTAKTGDVIYLPGGGFNLTDTINKKVHIIGTGYNSEIPRATLTSTILGNIIITKEAKGTIIEGVMINSKGSFEISASETTLRRCKIHRQINFKTTQNCQIINCITTHINGSYLHVYNSLLHGEFYADNSEIHNCIVRYFYEAKNCIAENTIWGIIYASTIDFTHCLHNGSAIYDNSSGELKKIFKNTVTNDFFNVKNDYHLLDSLATVHPQLGIYKGQYPWKDGGQPITPHIEENNSYLDVQNQKFKLRVKVKAQSK